MRYTGFEIINYKGVQRTRISLGVGARLPIVTLIGLNESGKTTILEAVHSFTYGRSDVSHLGIYGYRLSDPFELVPISRRSNFNEAIQIRADVLLSESDIDSLRLHLEEKHSWILKTASQSITVTDSWQFKASQHNPKEDKSRLWTFSITGKLRGKGGRSESLDGSSEVWHSAVRYLGEQMPPIWYFPNFLFDFPTRVYLDEQSDPNGPKNDRNRFFKEMIQTILFHVDNDATVGQHLVARAKSTDVAAKKSLKGLTQKIERHLTTSVFGAWSKAISTEHNMKAIRFGVETDERGRVFGTFQIEDNDGTFEIADRSLGFRWFFVFLLITKYIAADPNVQNAILLLDEPASNLHSTAQQRLLELFNDLSKSVTLVYATHSHHCSVQNLPQPLLNVVRRGGHGRASQA